MSRAATDEKRWSTPLADLPRRPMKQGYVFIRVAVGDWEAEHRMIAAQMLGRPLRDGESVHHRNGRRDDNRPENLEVWDGSHGHGQRLAEILHCPACGTRLELSAKAESLTEVQPVTAVS